jgi:hypothetical protein
MHYLRPRVALFILLTGLAGSRALEAADLVYSPVNPCRVIDTRLIGGKFAAGETRTYLLRGPNRNYSIYGGNPNGCGIPDLTPPAPVRRNVAQAVVVNVTAVNPDGPGNLRAWPANQPLPTSSVINFVSLAAFGITSNNVANEIILQMCDEANASPCPAGDVSLRADVSGVHVVVDVVGFMRVPDLAGILPRVLIYESTASANALPAQNTTVTTACNDANDFPLSGSCSTSSTNGSVVISGGRAVNWGNPAVPAEFACTFFNQIATTQQGTARLMCVGVP